MDEVHSRFTLRMSFSFLLLLLLPTSPVAAAICSAPNTVLFDENNKVGDVVVTIETQTGVTLEFSPPPANPNNPFTLEGNNLTAVTELDFETSRTHSVGIICTETATGGTLSIVVVVLVQNQNDNPPIFGENPYNVEVNEMSPVGSTVGRFAATDLDQLGQLYYTLTSESIDFKLKAPTIPEILVDRRLDYDKVNNVQLVLCTQDTPLTSEDGRLSFTATTTIIITIFDGDNRPPWFQPCTKQEVGGALVCQNSGYTGRVILNEQETGVLPLKPGPLYAIDGDSGINEEITYSFLSGNDGGLFEINPNTGNVTMLKPADVLGTISLVVLAAQKVNTYQFSTTTVTVSVQVKSLHPPQFQRPEYEGIITAVGTMAMDAKNKDRPLQIIATDDDYIITGGFNPHISYSVTGSSDFSIIGGFLFMTNDLPESTLTLQVVAKDASNDESATAQLSVVVTSGLTTTSLPLSTTNIITTTSVGESTTHPSTESSVSTTILSTESVSTTNPSLTSEGSVTASTAQPPTVIVASGGFGVAEMAALGATLGALLLVCLVVIGVLIHQMRKGKADWRKIYETSMFRSSLGQGSGGHKEGIQYTNEAFENDEDGGSIGSSGPAGGSRMAGGESRTVEVVLPVTEAIAKSSKSLHDLLPDDTSQTGSDKADSDKEVKPILTKERRMEEGYKSVWFKEDIDPNAKEEVVIIPDSRESDSEDEDEEQSSSGREENEDDNLPMKRSKVAFTEADLDSGLGVKMEDPAEDSDDDDML